jgi:DNA polymerase-1
MDSGRQTFRREIYTEYKANRPPAPPDLLPQMARCEAIVRAFCKAVYKLPGVEADDLIATVVKKAREERLRVVIVAADKDLMQLVGDDVLLWDTMMNRVIGPSEVETRFGVRVSQLGDLLALMGDTSDNVPGVPHVGPKTAKELLVEFGSLDGIYENLDAIKRKAVRETLATHRDDAFLSRRLIELKSDCAIDTGTEHLRWSGRDLATLRTLYTELGFQSQLARLEAESAAPAAATPPRAAPALARTPGEYSVVTDLGELRALVEGASRTERLALSASYEPDSPMRGSIIGIGLAVEPGRGAYVPLAHRYVGMPNQLARGEVLEVLAPVLLDPKVKKVGLDLKRLGVLFARSGSKVEGFSFDAGIASYLLDPEARHDREALAERELGIRSKSLDELTARGRGKKVDLDQIECAEAASYFAASADIALGLAATLGSRLSDAGLEQLFETVELPLARMLVDLELAGVLVDTQVLRALGDDAEREIARLEREAHRAAGHEFNVNSPRQLETILFDELGMKPLKRTKTSRSTDAETLESLGELHELPRIVLDIRSIAKLKGTYIDALPSLVHPSTGRIHTSWEQTVAATGRLSSSDPNLQNIPIRTELGRKIRAAFVPPSGHTLVSADYSQIELRVLAHLSGDPVLCDGFRTGQDVHQRTAMEIFGLASGDVQREHRTRAKAVNFGIIYGQGESGLAKALGIPRSEAASFIAAYYQRYQGVRRFMNETLERARTGESVRSVLGRRRLVPGIRSANRAERLAAERIAMNMPIQGSAADILKLAMLALRSPVTPGAKMILSVHDELVFEVPNAEVEEAKEKIRSAMQSAYELVVPLTVDVGSGPNWNAAH